MATPQPQQFAAAWIKAWNDHDLELIVSHYAQQVEYCSPFVSRLTGEQSGVIKGIPAVRAYFEQALTAYPELHFELINVLAGVNSVVLYYRSVNSLTAAEYMEFDEQGKIEMLVAHYSS